MNPALLVRLTEIFIAAGASIQALEHLVGRRVYAPGGLYDWRVISTNARWMSCGPTGAILGALFEYRVFVGLIAAQLAAAVLLLVGILPGGALALTGVLLGVHMLFLLRNQYGLDGSDQMMLMVLWGLFAYRLHPTERMLTIAFAFIAGQLVLSYCTAGFAKATSKVWRGGDAVPKVLSTASYGTHWLADLLLRHRTLAVLSCWFVILYECGGPAVLWLHPAVCLAFIGVGAIFHLSIAMFMGLNIFFWSFIATYPAVYYCATRWSLF
jgi:hypothetical protein